MCRSQLFYLRFFHVWKDLPHTSLKNKTENADALGINLEKDYKRWLVEVALNIPMKQLRSW